MPAVNPRRLSRELDSLVDLIGDPDETARACLNLLDLYADRTRRPTLTTTADLARKFGAPGPVIRELSHRLAQSARTLPDEGERLAGVLWNAGYRETRLAAAAIYAQRADEQVPAWVEARARECRDSVVLKALAAQSLRAWCESDIDAFLDWVWHWLDDADSRLHRVALLSLGEALRRPAFPLEPRIFQALNTRLDDLTDGSRRALGDLLRLMAGRSPAETAKLLEDHLKDAHRHRHLLTVVKGVLPHFPQRQRSLLEATLSDDGSG
jgi:hypothetical protein